MAANITPPRRIPKRRRRILRPLKAHSHRIASGHAAGGPPDMGEVLREELNLIYAILNTTSALILVTDPQGQIVRCNSACEQTTGYSFHELNGRTFQDFLLPGESGMVTAVFGKLRADHSPCEYTGHWIAKDGSQRLIAWSNVVLPSSGDSVQYIICTGIDITERQQAAERVRLQAHLLDVVEQAIIATDLSGTIIYQNHFAEELYGWSAAETVGRNIQEITANGISRAQELAIIARLSMHKSWSGELIVHRWDGTAFPAVVTASPVRNDKDELIGTISVSTDITAQKQAEYRLQHYIKRLENLRDTEHAVLVAQSPEKIAEAAISQLRQLIPSLWASVAVFDFEADEVQLLAVQSEGETSFEIGAHFPLDVFGIPEPLTSGKAYVVEDIQNLAQLEPMSEILRREGARSYIRVPLMVHDDLIGSLNLAAATPAAFTAEHIDVAHEVADQLAIAIYTARLFTDVRRYAAELERRVDERTAALSKANELLSRQIQERQWAEAAERQQRALAEALREIASMLNSTLDLDEVLVRILANMGRVVPHDAVNIMFIESDVVRVVRCQGYDRYALGEVMFNLKFPIDDIPYMRQAASTGQAIIASDTRTFPAWIAFPGANWVRSYVGAPISLEGSVIGFLNVDSATPGFFTPLHAERLGAFADQAAIAIQNARLYEQSQAVAALEERQRLSHELHDAISQTLWSASLIADVLPDLWEQNVEKGRQKLVRLRQLTRGALAEMRTLLLELHPTALTEVSLGDLLQRLCDIATSRTGITILPVLEGQISLPPNVQIALYRMAQESLSNIARHAAASQITVHLHCDPQLLTLRISDNGRGFDLDRSRPGHMGLDIMHQRAQSIGASLTINSQVGQGTEIIVAWSPNKE
jgi:PAS domain S-box-containing protein